MNLEDSFLAICPCVVGFISKLKRGSAGQRPLFPPIFATGFLVDERGIAVTNRHVIDVFDKIPRHPQTGEFAGAAFMFFVGDDRKSVQFLMVDIKAWYGLQSFTASSEWYGTSIPDVGFVHLGVRGVPALNLASNDFALRVGMPISTVGYPMGDLPLTVLGKLHQMTPFLRTGVVSSVFPFPTAKPHGFTIDIMQQGGSSGSPIFPLGEQNVVGMMSSSVLDMTTVQANGVSLTVPQNTNISIAESASIIQSALDQFRQQNQISLEGVPSLDELRALYPEGTSANGFEWDAVGRPDTKVI